MCPEKLNSPPFLSLAAIYTPSLAFNDMLFQFIWHGHIGSLEKRYLSKIIQMVALK